MDEKDIGGQPVPANDNELQMRESRARLDMAVGGFIQQPTRCLSTNNSR